jgi:hypothetical protein
VRPCFAHCENTAVHLDLQRPGQHEVEIRVLRVLFDQDRLGLNLLEHGYRLELAGDALVVPDDNLVEQLALQQARAVRTRKAFDHSLTPRQVGAQLKGWRDAR